MEELNLVFNNYIEEVKKLDITEKRNELINSIESLANEDKIEIHYLKNREILDLSNNHVSEDDFIEAALVYLEVAKNIIGDYLLQKEQR